MSSKARNANPTQQTCQCSKGFGSQCLVIRVSFLKPDLFVRRHSLCQVNHTVRWFNAIVLFLIRQPCSAVSWLQETFRGSSTLWLCLPLGPLSLLLPNLIGQQVEEERMETSVHLLSNHLSREMSQAPPSLPSQEQELVTWPHLEAGDPGKCSPGWENASQEHGSVVEVGVGDT